MGEGKSRIVGGRTRFPLLDGGDRCRALSGEATP